MSRIARSFGSRTFQRVESAGSNLARRTHGFMSPAGYNLARILPAMHGPASTGLSGQPSSQFIQRTGSNLGRARSKILLVSTSGACRMIACVDSTQLMLHHGHGLNI